eukprot:scaffold1483_cov145-Skeletonema_marinoi.AAC.1
MEPSRKISMTRPLHPHSSLFQIDKRMKGGGNRKASGRIKLSYAVLLLLCSVTAWLAASATDERQPQPCWKHRVWGLRLDDEGRDDRCITAFIHNSPHYMNRIPPSSTLRAADQDKDSHIDLNVDSEGQHEQNTSSASSSQKPKSKSEWIDGRTVMQLMELEKAREEQERQRQLEMELFNNRFQSPPAPSFKGSSRERVKDISIFRSRISYTDANTLQIELPPSGVNADVFFSGAFSALWFSAVGPATVGMLSSGGAAALFMAPFWLAGGMVAKMAVVDPFVSTKLTIGDYLWALEKNYFRRRGKLTSKKQDGPTETLRGASVEVGMVVNNVPRYELRLYFDGNTVSFGKGLSVDELEYLAETINEHCTMIGEIPTLEE